MMKIQAILQAQRKQQGLSQIDLAKRAGLTQAMISKIEAGKDVRFSTLQAAAQALGLHILALNHAQAFQLHQTMNANVPQKSLLEQFQVNDDED